LKFDLYLEKQVKLHPSMQMQDVIKMCYQAVFGPEHLLADIECAKKYFMQEYETAPANQFQPLYESVSDTFCRVNLRAWKARALEPEKLFHLFVASATGKTPGAEVDFYLCIKEVEEMITRGILPFSLEEWQVYFAAYKKSGIHPVHHSDAYRLAEQPAYRLVCKSLLNAALPE